MATIISVNIRLFKYYINKDCIKLFPAILPILIGTRFYKSVKKGTLGYIQIVAKFPVANFHKLLMNRNNPAKGWQLLQQFELHPVVAITVFNYINVVYWSFNYN